MTAAPNESIASAVVEQATRRPDAVAVTDARGELRYGELLARAFRLAVALRERGLGRERTVGVCLPRGGDLVVAEVGVMLSGAAFVPLDPELPKDRLSRILADADVGCVVTDASHDDRLPAQPARVFVGGQEPSTLADAVAGAREFAKEISERALAYVIYTSGSTGRPKGVMVEHASLASFVAWHRTAFALDEQTRATMIYSPGFDSSLAEIWPAVTAGASLHVVPCDVRSSPDRLVAWLVGENVTFTDLPTPLLEALLPLPWPAGGSLRTVLTGGDRLKARPRSEHPWTLYNQYGPTEATVTATSALVSPGPLESAKELPPIGAPIRGAAAYVLDEQLAPVEPGAEGELYLGGDGVARGYRNDPELTAARFLPDPFSARPGARMYRTGDRARWGADATPTLHFCGRADEQIKIRGYRIEPIEIVSALSMHPHIATAHVCAHGGALVAYFVLTDPRFVPATAQLREHLAKQLPEYMIPASFVLVDRLPVTASGKVDVGALPAPMRDRSALSGSYAAPTTDVERALVAIWADVLRFGDLGIDDDFFELGGQSLLVAQIRKRIFEELAVDLAICDVMVARRIRPLAEKIEALRAGEGSGRPMLPPLTRAPDRATHPLSIQQQQVWFFQKLAPKNISYQAQTTIRVFGPLDITLLERAMTEVTRRHEILRTTYGEEDGKPFAVVLPNLPASIPIIDLRDRSEADREEERRAIVRRELETPLSLYDLPLARWTAVRLSAEEHELILIEHHVVHDGESFGILMSELETLYNAFAAGKPSPLPELPVQYSDFAAWQTAALESPALQAQLAFWRERLRGAPTELALPTDRPRPKTQGFRGDLVRVVLPPALPAALRGLSKKDGVTLFTILFAAFSALIHRMTGEPDFCIGSAVANRGVPLTERVIGMFVNAVVLRCDVTADMSFRALLRRTAAIVTDASMNEVYPFPKLVEALGLPRDLSRNPLFQAMFSFHDSVVTHPSFGRASGTVFERGNGSSKVDLDVVVIPHFQRHLGDKERGDDRITMLWEYDCDLFDHATVAQMAAHFTHLLEAAVLDPDTLVCRLPLVADDERAHLVGALARGAPAPARVAGLEDVIAVATSRPFAVAVSGDGDKLLYGALLARGVKLAEWLVSRGVGPEDRVGICLPRGADLVVAQLGVMLAGGAFVPVDPDYPRERLQIILADAGVALVVTQPALEERLPEAIEPVAIGLFRESDGDVVSTARELARRIEPSALAYVIYTSGSTGRPKGVMIEHASLWGFVAWHREELGIGEQSRTTMIYSPGFDSSLAEIWPAMTVGASVHVVPPDARPSPERLIAWLVETKITFADLPTPLVELLLALPWPSAACVQTIAAGGDRLHGRPRADHPFALFNEYGPTEATVTATSGRVLPGPDGANEMAPPSIGRPIAGATAYVLDEHLVPVPVGVPGELYIGGSVLARGYANLPELTRARFLPDPFSGAPGARMYRTGDRARWRSDGELHFSGRVDEQVKIRGHRIEPAEVVSALCLHPAIADAHVLAALPPRGDLTLVAYVAPSPGAPEPTVDEIRRHLAARLPVFMVPSTYVVVDSLPVTSRGKVDRRALPPPRWGRASSPDLERAKTRTQQIVATIWKATLHLDDVGVHESFFDVGGNSLLLAAVHQAIERAVDRSFPLLALFEHPTIASFSTALEAIETASPPASENGAARSAAEARRSGALLLQQRRRSAGREGGSDS